MKAKRNQGIIAVRETMFYALAHVHSMSALALKKNKILEILWEQNSYICEIQCDTLHLVKCYEIKSTCVSKP